MRIRHTKTILMCIGISIVILTGCGGDQNAINEPTSEQNVAPVVPDSAEAVKEVVAPVEVDVEHTPEPDIVKQPDEVVSPVEQPTVDEKPIDNGPSVQVVADPDTITALVNKQYSLPKDFTPAELVYPNIDFIFSEKIDKRKLRKEAAEAVEQLFTGAADDQIILLGVSAYRSNATQKALFERYVKRDGEAKARTYSAVPGHSEHETGLAIDVTGGDGKCAATDCFGDTKEAAWLAEHAAEYGFIIRYPQGKQEITGYKYEPWHLRYVGTTLAQEIAASNGTLEEYYDAVPVSQ